MVVDGLVLTSFHYGDGLLVSGESVVHLEPEWYRRLQLKSIDLSGNNMLCKVNYNKSALFRMINNSPMRILYVVVASWLGHSVKIGGSTHGVCTHIIENNPVASIQVGHLTVVSDAVQAIASWSPDAASEAWIISILKLLESYKGISLEKQILNSRHSGIRNCVL